MLRISTIIETNKQLKAVVTNRGKKSLLKESNASTTEYRGQGGSIKSLSLGGVPESIPPYFRKCQFIWRVQTLMQRTPKQARSPLYPCGLLSDTKRVKKSSLFLIADTQFPDWAAVIGKICELNVAE